MMEKKRLTVISTLEIIYDISLITAIAYTYGAQVEHPWYVFSNNV